MNYTQAEVDAHNAKVAAGHKAPTVEPKPAVADLTLKPCTDEAKLNKTERAYLAYLRRLNPPYIGIQNITLKLADDCRLTMDFSYINANGRMTFVDTKGGFWREDAKIKVKVAARIYRWADFIVAHKEGVIWREELIKP